MKTNSKKKIVVSALAVAMGAALVGSISGSVAWYQYSTRTTAQMTATSAGTSRNLQIRLGKPTSSGSEGDWKTNLSASDISTYLAAKYSNENQAAGKLSPVTSGAQAKNANINLANFKGHPVYQYQDLPAAKGTEYIQIEFQFQCLDNNVAVAGKNIYLVDADLTGVTGDDISGAIRLHFHSETADALAAKTATETVTWAEEGLDIGGDVGVDKDGFDGNTGNIVQYGSLGSESGANDSNKQTSYALSGKGTANDLLAADEKTENASADAYNFVGGQVLATTSASAAVSVTMTMWLEGWADISDSTFTDKTIWDISLINKTVEVALRFACPAEE